MRVYTPDGIVSVADLFADAEPETENIPFTTDDAITRFLNRWIWRTERREVVEQELRQLIAEAEKQ